MKKILSLLMIISFITIPARAEIVGSVLTTDINAYIDYLRVPSYNIDGYTAVIVRDLENYGFTVNWDESSRTVNFYRDFAKPPEPKIPSHDSLPVGTKLFDVQSTDIKVYYRGTLIPSYNIDGRTAVRFRDLAMVGSPQFNEETRSADIFCYDVEFFDDEIDYMKNHFYKNLDLLAEADIMHQPVVSMIENGRIDEKSLKDLKSFYGEMEKSLNAFKEYREPYGFNGSSMELWWAMVNQKYATEKLLEMADTYMSGRDVKALMNDYRQFRSDSYEQRRVALLLLYEDMMRLTFFWY